MIPIFAKKNGSTVEKRRGDPSAPSPLFRA